MKYCQFCYAEISKRVRTCPKCGTAGSLQVLKNDLDPYERFNEHFRIHFDGHPRANCRYCDINRVN